MKKIIYSLLFVITAVCAACDEELPKASFDLYELKTLTATAGDMKVAQKTSCRKRLYYHRAAS